MKEEKLIEVLKNVKIDSADAVLIAEQWIELQYWGMVKNLISTGMFMIPFAGIVGWLFYIAHKEYSKS